MAINVEVSKTGNENNGNVMRRFTKKIQRSGILQAVRGRRYAKRNPSKYTKKKSALKILARRKEIQQLIKLGKITEKVASR